jgi:hypothetical protein
VIEYSNDVRDFPKWEMLNREQLDKIIKDIFPLLSHYIAEIGLDTQYFEYDPTRMYAMIDMVEKRRIYFHIFHSIQMGELNEICLYVFWILKLRPFRYIMNPNMDVNYLLAVKLFCSGLFYVNGCIGKVGKQLKSNDNIFTLHSLNHLTHAFLFQDLSKEAIALLGESMLGGH